MTDKHALIQPDKGQAAIPIHLVNKETLPAFRKTLNAQQRAALDGQKFTGGGYEVAVVPDGPQSSGGWFALGGVANPDELSSWCMAKLAAPAVPPGAGSRPAARPA